MMDRRAFLGTVASGLLAAPLAAEAQQPRKVYKIGFLSANLSQAPRRQMKSFLIGLRDLGYVEGRDFVMEYRWAEGHNDRLPELAADLVRVRVDVIVTGGTPPTMAAKQATQTIPIVFAVLGAAVEKGIVGSLARPGGNVTGLTFQIELGKVLGLLKEAVPSVARVVYLYDPDSSRPGLAERLRSYTQPLNVESQVVAVRDSTRVAQAFAEVGRGTNGLLVDNATYLQINADEICKLALRRRLSAAGIGRLFADAGCLMSYGEDLLAMYRRAAGYVDKILKGAKPSDLPVEQADRFELVINLKTAKALGLTIPPSLLGRADEVIQ
jgi:putative tryptophan/tyrosine transport system substrate-binding protein